MTDPKLPEQYRDPTRYRLLDGGGVYGLQEGHIVAHIGGKYTITKENALAMRERGKDIAMIAQLRGLASARGVELPDDAELETIVHGAASAVEALTRHMTRTFLSSENLRGMAEGYSKLIAPMTGEIERGGAPMVFIQNNSGADTARLFERVLRDVMQARNGEVVEGEAKDVPEGE